MKTSELLEADTRTLHGSYRGDTDSITIGSLDPEARDRAASVLTQSFIEYPLVRYMFEGAESSISERMSAMFSALIEMRLGCGWPVLACHVAEELVGVAVVSGPVETPCTPEAQAMFEAAALKMGDQPARRFDDYARVCDLGTPTWPHYYLGILGVLPDYQGLGLGQRLVIAVQSIAQSDPRCKGVSLNTEATVNLPFYSRLGFRVTSETPVGWVRTWAMAWQKVDEISLS